MPEIVWHVPVQYQQGLTRWIIEHIFNDKKRIGKCIQINLIEII